jgi:hypothetical protein
LRSLVGKPRCAWVPQDGGLWPHCTVLEHLEIARGNSDGLDVLIDVLDLPLA